MARRFTFTIIYAPETYKHLDWIEPKYHRLVQTTIKEQLAHTPGTGTRKPQAARGAGLFRRDLGIAFWAEQLISVFYDLNHEEKRSPSWRSASKKATGCLLAERSSNYGDRSAGGEGPFIITRNGKSAAVLLAPKNNDDLERLMLAHSRRFQSLLNKSRRSIKAGKGVSHGEFWKTVARSHRAKRPAKVRKRSQKSDS